MKTFPLLYQIALNVLSVHESAVTCERTLSSCEELETDANQGAYLSSKKIEQLQIPQFGLRNEWLSPTDDLVCTDRRVTISAARRAVNMPPDIVNDMYVCGKVD